MRKKTILITGASGYIGRYLLKSLLHDDYLLIALVRNLAKMPCWLMGSKNLTVLEGNLQDKKTLAKALKEVDVVIHLAASLRMFEKVGELYKTNIVGLKNILQSVADANRPMKFIFFSSIDVEKRNSDYAFSKKEGEEIVIDFCRSNPKIKYVIIRAGNVSGGREGGIVKGIRNLMVNGGWKSSVLYHQLGEKNLYLIEMSDLVHRVKDLIDRPKSVHQICAFYQEKISARSLIHRLRLKKPPKIPFGDLFLRCWKVLGLLLKRGDLLIYLDSER